MNVIILIEAFDQLQFFEKFKKWFKKLDQYPTIITDKLSIYIILKLTSEFNICLLKEYHGKVDIPDLTTTFEILTNQFSINKAELLYSSAYACADSIIKNHENSIFFIWGGNTISALALKNVAQSYSSPMLYFDFGNYGNKIFVDLQGTNINSFIYNHYESIFDGVGNRDFKDTGTDFFCANKLKFKRNIKNINLFFLLDVFYCWINGLPFRGEVNPLKKIYMLINPSYERQKEIFLNNLDYYFIAFSHSYEIKKLKLEIPEVLKKVLFIIEEAKKRGTKVLAKFHPNEMDKSFMNSINKLENTRIFKVVNNDAIELIEQAKKVYLFNTSLSIPSILKRKDISFMSKSFFDKFDRNSLIFYLNYYLIELSIDSEGYFDDTTVERILQRLRIEQDFTIK